MYIHYAKRYSVIFFCTVKFVQEDGENTGRWRTSRRNEKNNSLQSSQWFSYTLQKEIFNIDKRVIGTEEHKLEFENSYR